MSSLFDLQGHRGARGLRPENTLPSFEAALDAGVTSIETDVHLTSNAVPVLCHDACLSPVLCRRRSGSSVPSPARRPLLSTLTSDEVTNYIADRNPDRRRFPDQAATPTPVAEAFASLMDIDPFAIPTLPLALRFLDAYAGAEGRRAGKSLAQRRRARAVRLDLELKRMPGCPEAIGDNFDGTAPGLLEKVLLPTLSDPRWRGRLSVRSFDHRAVRVLTQALPGLPAAVLVAEMAPVDPAALARAASADIYCPDYLFLDGAQVERCHAGGVRVVPWTVNDEAEWARLVAWGVDGITTDFPDRLAAWLRANGVRF
jgi:glycerophosphoryl diester phosphodiesterase